MKNFLSYIALFVWLVTIQAQNHRFNRLTEDDGLPANDSYSFLKDDRGFIWIGTANGLCRYDGVEITPFTQEQGYTISNDHINILVQDSNGIIWIGTDAGGLNSFNPKTEIFESFQHDPNNPTTIAGDRIQSIVQGEDNTLWIGFDNGYGLSKFNTETKKSTNYKPFQKLNTDGVRAIRDLIYDKKNSKVWLGSTHGLISLDLITEEFQLITHPLMSINRHGLFALDRIDENRLLAGFFHAGIDIYNINEQSWDQVYTDPAELTRIYNLSRKSESEFWVAARKKGLATFNLNSKKLQFLASDFNNQNTPFPGFTYEVEGFDQDVWVGGKHGVSYAVSRSSPFVFNSLDFRNSELGRVNDISGKYDKIYMIGVDNRLWEFDKISDKQTTYEITPESNTILSGMLELEDRIYLIANNNEILLFDKTFKTISSIAGPLEQASLENIIPWKKDLALVISRYGGTFTLELKTNSLDRIHEAKIPDQWQHDVLTLDDGTAWIGTIGSIVILSSDGEQVDLYYPEVISSKKEKQILSMKQDHVGTIWIGTVQGLLKIQGKEETLYNVLNSDLPSNFISDIEFDQHNYMWISTRKGVSRVDPNSMEMTHFDSSDEIDSEGILQEVDGEIYYGAQGGYYNLSFRNKIEDPALPRAHFTEFQVLGEKKKLELAVDFTKIIDLEYWENSFSFSFAAPVFDQPQRLKYAYRLTGLNNKWIITNSRRYANYTNLDGGKYTFELKVGNRDGDWSEVRKINIHLFLPFWETWWFYTICSLLILGAGFVFYKTRIRILQQKADQEAQELRLEAFKKRLMELNASPPDLILDFDEVNSKLATPLSQREFEVLKMSLDGKSNAEIAEGLFISLSTVKFHLRNTYSKLGVSNRKEALVYVVKKS